MTDNGLISKQRVIDVLLRYQTNQMLEGKDASIIQRCVDKVRQLPLAQAERKEGGWIPFKECYPKHDEVVLFMYRKGMAVGRMDWCEGLDGFIVHTKNACYTMIATQCDGEIPIAWQPLPSPYQEES